jgi:hypothetical protein
MAEVYIYKSKHDFTLVLRPGRGSRGSDGGWIPGERGKKVAFIRGTLQVDEHLAKHLGTSIGEIVKMLEESPSFGSEFKLFSSPTKEPTDDEKEAAQKAAAMAKKKEVKVVSGARTV